VRGEGERTDPYKLSLSSGVTHLSSMLPSCAATGSTSPENLPEVGGRQDPCARPVKRWGELGRKRSTGTGLPSRGFQVSHQLIAAGLPGSSGNRCHAFRSGARPIRAEHGSGRGNHRTGRSHQFRLMAQATEGPQRRARRDP